MQSTFKLPLAVVVLGQVQAGRFKLDQPIRFLASDRYPGTYSPLQDAHPAGDVDVSLRELLQLSVGKSDNTATDILLRIVGGPAFVQHALDALGYPAIHIRDSERGLHDDGKAQYRNDAEPAEMVRLLRSIADHSPLNPELTRFLLDTMTASTTGMKRLRAGLPAGTPLAHKTGTSGTDAHGVASATNDVGLITLRDGRRLAIAVFVAESTASEDARDGVIAGIAKAVYDEAVKAR